MSRRSGGGGGPGPVIRLAAIWIAAAISTLLLSTRVLWPLALDFQTLTFGMYELENMPFDVVPSGTAFIRYGAAPLFLLVFAALFHRIVCRDGQPLWPFSSISPLFTALIQGLAFACWAACTVPLSVGIAVRTTVEAYWWVQWHDNVKTVTEQILTWAPAVLLPGMLVAGAWALGVALMMPRPVRPGWGWRLARMAWKVPAGALIAVTLVALVPVAGRTVQLSAAPGHGTFSRVCSGCHGVTQPLNFVKTPGEWKRAVTRMQEKHGAKLAPDEAESVVAFLMAIRGFGPKATFRARCQRCHWRGTGDWKPRDRQEWAGLVHRMSRWSPRYYPAPVREQLVSYLSSEFSEKGATLGLDPSTHSRLTEVVKTCTACHSVSLSADRYRAAQTDELEALVSRMGQKMRGGLAPASIKRLAAAYQDLISDPARMNRLVPHDRPMASPGGVWW